MAISSPTRSQQTSPRLEELNKHEALMLDLNKTADGLFSQPIDSQSANDWSFEPVSPLKQEKRQQIQSLFAKKTAKSASPDFSIFA